MSDDEYTGFRENENKMQIEAVIDGEVIGACSMMAHPKKKELWGRRIGDLILSAPGGPLANEN